LTLTANERRALASSDDAQLSLSEQVKLLGISRASLYYQPVPPSPEEIRLKHRIDELYTESPFYGSRRMTRQLEREGEIINRKRVQRYMREMGIEGICPGPNLSKRNLAHRVYPYLLRGRVIERKNQVWGIDITYIRWLAGWLYLVAILDWHSRYVVGWQLSESLEMDFVLETVKDAFEVAVPEIFNSDQGSHFTSEVYIELLQEAGTQISMDGKGRALDNIFTERLWRTIKYEEVYLHEYGSEKAVRRGLENYLEFYNHRRLHQSLNYQTPAEVYFG
jgi:putative transposase